MKRFLATILFIVLLGGLGMAQPWDIIGNNQKLREMLNLTDEELNKLEKLWEETERIIQMSRADLKITTGKLEKLLLSPHVELREVEALLREAMEFEFKLRFAQITRQVKAKEILGEKRWAQLNRTLRQFEKQGPQKHKRP